MDNRKPLLEFFLLENKVKEPGKALKLRGIFQIANEVNQNGRIYPKEILEREVKKFEKLVQERRAIGELDHPDVSVVQLQNASHVITDLSWDGDKLMGEIEILPTRNGQILEALVNAGITFGISSRAVGSTQRTAEGKEQVQDDLQLLTFDVVSNPSVAEAMLTEGVKKELQNTNRTYLIESILDDILGKNNE